MVVPRGWTLDDLRDPDLHLFRPPVPSPLPAPPPRTRAVRPASHHVAEQLQLATGNEPPSATDDSDGDDEAASDARPWSPSFDESDDLDGLLSARGPLLSRAFRTADRSGE
jgi:hypothetical protein